MYRLETREREDLDDWYPVIDMKRSRSKSVVRIFMNEQETNAFVKSEKLQEGLYRVVEIDE